MYRVCTLKMSWNECCVSAGSRVREWQFIATKTGFFYFGGNVGCQCSLSSIALIDLKLTTL